MNRLPREKQIQIITALVEGCSIRSIERMYDVHRDTVTRLMLRTGDHCMTLLEDHIRDVPAGTIQCDEIWIYVRKKDRRFTVEDMGNKSIGSQFIWIAMDADTKLVISHLIGKRELQMAFGLIVDLKDRIVGRPTIITDGLVHYFDAVHYTFGRFDVDFAQLVKVVKEGKPKRVREGYEPAKMVSIKKYPLFGEVETKKISTSYIERQNATIRQSMRRLTRLTYGFSKKLENLKAASALHFAHYNFCRVHKSLSTTPAMAANLTNTIWEISDLLPQ